MISYFLSFEGIQCPQKEKNSGNENLSGVSVSADLSNRSMYMNLITGRK